MQLDFETLAKLAMEHGDAFYLLDLEGFRANLRELAGEFRRIHPKTSLGYSYKTNYTPLLCRAADEEGCYAEVVSGLEYDMAARLGVAPERVIFNGPLKSPDEIERALLAGSTVNVDSIVEIEAIEHVARKSPDVCLRVGVRCNFALEEDHSSRFGIPVDQLGAALDRLRALPRTRVGLHCHFSAHRSAEAFRRRTERMLDLADAHFRDAPPASIDVGGGFFGRMPEELRAHFGTDVPSYRDYAEAVASVVAARYGGDDAPELVLEPGASVVADAIQFVARVTSLKQLGARKVAVCTGSIQNVKAMPGPSKPPMRAVRDTREHARPTLEGPVEVTGYTCMEFDVMQTEYPGTLALGDFLVFQNVGAYTTVFKPPFIRAAPPILAYGGESGTFTTARRAETLEDVLATYAL